MTNRKILLVTKDFPPTYCGIGDYTHQLMKRLMNEGYQVNCFTSAHQGREKDDSIIEYTGSWNIGASFTMWRIAKQQPSVVLFQYVPYNFSRWGMPCYLLLFYLLCFFTKVPVITFFHEYAIRWNWRSPKEMILAIVQRILGTSILMISRFNATSSTYYQSLFPFPQQLSVVPIPSNFEGIEPNRQHNTQQNVIQIFSFANRVDTWLLDVMKVVKEQSNTEFNWVICGKDKKERQQSLLKELDQRNMLSFVDYKGEQTPEQFAYWLHVSDIFLQYEYVSKNGEGGASSKNTTIAAAMLAGLAILTTCGDMTDAALYRNKENVWFLNLHSKEKIVEELLEIIQDNTWIENLKNASHSTYQTFFSWSNTLHWYIQNIQLCSIK